jgi:hypothetical protein
MTLHEASSRGRIATHPHGFPAPVPVTRTDSWCEVFVNIRALHLYHGISRHPR